MADSRLVRVLLLWLFGDIIYAILPIITVAAIYILSGVSFEEFLLIKEWSFASIVFFGVAIRRVIHRKVHIEQKPTSYTLDAGVQMYIALLVIAVLVLSVVIFLEIKGVPFANRKAFIGWSQLTLFFLGAFSLFVSVALEDKFSHLSTNSALLHEDFSEQFVLSSFSPYAVRR